MATVARPLPPAEPTIPTAPGAPTPELELDERGGSRAVVASQWQLMYWRFTRHKLAVISVFVVAAFYLVAVFCEFLSPMDPNKISNTYRYVPPQPISFVNHKGEFSLRPGVFWLTGTRDPETLRMSYEVDKTRWVPISLFVQGDPYKFWGLWRTNIHLIGLNKADVAAIPAAAPAAATRPSVIPTPGAGMPGPAGVGSIGGFSGQPAAAPTRAPASSGMPGAAGVGSIGGFSTGAAPTAAPTAVRGPAPATTSPNVARSVGLSAPSTDPPFYLMGTDRLGRDMLSRLLYGTRISLSLGFMGVVLSFVLGIVLGGVSGFYGGAVDDAIQRVIEFVRSMPTIPLWLALAAAMPSKWPPEAIYFAITVILSLFGWTGLARVVRGRFLALREEDFILAARFTNCSERRIIFRHMVPAFMSHIIASCTLAVPGMILAETSLSFLGLGLRSPVISWGVLLQEAQNIQSVALFPWLLSAGIPVVTIILAFNFMGDGLRDAADPYAR